MRCCASPSRTSYGRWGSGSRRSRRWRLPGLSGLELQQRLAVADLAMPIIFMTGHGDIPMTVQVMQAGAVEFLNHVDRSDRGMEGCLAYL
jgi:response regulator receiver domain-containing protein